MTKEFTPWIAAYVTRKLRRMGTRRSIHDVRDICLNLIRGEAANGYCDCDPCKEADPTVDFIRHILKENGYLKDPIKAEEDKR